MTFRFFVESSLDSTRLVKNTGQTRCEVMSLEMANQLFFYLFALHIFPLQLALNSTLNCGSKSCEQLSAVDHVVAKGLEEGKDIEREESLINLSVILTNMAEEEQGMFDHLDKYLASLLDHLTQESRLRLIVISDATLARLLRLHLNM